MSAVDFYKAIPKTHNCAQSIVAGNNRNDLLDKMKDCGGGKADGGICGALFAALELVQTEEKAILYTEFIKSTGSDLCLDLKTKLKFPCESCVEIGDLLAKKYQR